MDVADPGGNLIPFQLHDPFSWSFDTLGPSDFTWNFEPSHWMDHSMEHFMETPQLNPEDRLEPSFPPRSMCSSPPCGSC